MGLLRHILAPFLSVRADNVLLNKDQNIFSVLNARLEINLILKLVFGRGMSKNYCLNTNFYWSI